MSCLVTAPYRLLTYILSLVGGQERRAAVADQYRGAAMATVPESEMDITSLLQPRQGYLWKLGGGQEKGSKWNRRW